MAEVRFQVDEALYAAALEFKQLGHFDSIGSAIRSLMGVYLKPTTEAIKRNQAAIATGTVAASPAPLLPTPQPAPPSPGGFGESLAAMLKP